MIANCMQEDWTKTYRPRKFEELWSIEDGHRYLMAALQTGTLARAILLMGSYGLGKSTTARIVAQAISCQKRNDHNPCGKCDGCEFCDTPMMGLYGSALFIQ